MSSDIARLHAAGVSVAGDDTDAIHDILTQFAGMKSAIREAEAAFKQRLLDIIRDTGRDIVVGDVRYYAGTKRETECVDVKGAIESALTVTGGDLDMLVSLLCKDPVKPGAARAMLPASDFALLFRMVEKPVLKEGRPVKELLSVDTKFVK